MNNQFYKEYPLKSIPYGNCRVIIRTLNKAQREITLRSYSTDVAYILLDDFHESAIFYANGVYSCTTGRHLNRFTKEFCGANLYHEIKKICGFHTRTYHDIITGKDLYTTAATTANRYIWER